MLNGHSHATPPGLIDDRLTIGFYRRSDKVRCVQRCVVVGRHVIALVAPIWNPKIASHGTPKLLLSTRYMGRGIAPHSTGPSPCCKP